MRTWVHHLATSPSSDLWPWLWTLFLDCFGPFGHC